MGSVRAKAVVLVALVGVALPWMLGISPLHQPQVNPPCRFTTTLLCAEFASDDTQLHTVVHAVPNTPQNWRTHLWLDTVFIVFSTLIFVLAAHTWKARHALLSQSGKACALFGFISGLWANYWLLTSLNELAFSTLMRDEYTQLVRPAALARFISFSMAAMTLLQLMNRGARSPWASIVYGLAALPCIAGLFFFVDTTLIESALIGTSSTALFCVVHAVIALTQHSDSLPRSNRST